MKPLMFLAIQIIAIVALVGGTAFFGLIFRNPTRPDWLKRGWTDSAAAVAIAAAFSGVIGFGIWGSAQLGMGVPAGIALTAALFIGAVIAIARGFHLAERLRRAERGEWPFGHLEPHVRELRSTPQHPAP